MNRVYLVRQSFQERGFEKLPIRSSPASVQEEQLANQWLNLLESIRTDISCDKDEATMLRDTISGNSKDESERVSNILISFIFSLTARALTFFSYKKSSQDLNCSIL